LSAAWAGTEKTAKNKRRSVRAVGVTHSSRWGCDEWDTGSLGAGMGDGLLGNMLG
jgi:hypothetical protein